MLAEKGSGITAAKDFVAAALNCGIKRRKKDLGLIFSRVPAVACGLFTQNRLKAAPILVTKEHLQKTTAQAIIINSGNANACTGNRGLENAYSMAEEAGKRLGIRRQDVLVASTGVIGKQLPMDRIRKAIPPLIERLDKSGGGDLAEAIMTTDKIIKEAALKITVNGKDAVIGAVAKGAGMIHPSMATMLVFITTDVYITRRALKRALVNAVERSFNSISVDGDMSTNDCVLALANGSAGNRLVDKKGRDFAVFSQALADITEGLARSIVMDGEGATKFVEINVKNAKRLENAKRIARSVATSTLFKTALFGEDPNWGRLAASVGASGVIFDPKKVDIYIGKTKVLKGGAGLPGKKTRLKKLFKKRHIDVTIDLNSGNKEYRMWTCDLTSNYVRLNAHYTT